MIGELLESVACSTYPEPARVPYSTNVKLPKVTSFAGVPSWSSALDQPAESAV